MSDTSLLNKAGILIKGSITRSALLLLGRSDTSYYFDNFVPRITWTLYNADGSVKAYEHFGMPFLLVVDKVYAKIRNEKYRYIAGQMTLFPDEVNQYDPDVIKEVLNNCIAQADYRMHGKINVEEFEDRTVFINEGSFIPETIEQALEEGYTPPYYRNAFLCDAMVNLYMIDTISMGIQKIYQVQKNKCFPLPTYDLENPNRVKVTLYGEILNRNYTQLLHSNEALNLQTVFLLDKVQKNQTISKEEAHVLKKQRLIEGRYPHVFVSSEIATIVGKPDDYVIENNASALESLYKRIKRKANFPYKFHSLRHYYASIMLAEGVPNKYAKERMGHKTDNMLNRVYQHTMPEYNNAISAKLEEFFTQNIDSSDEK